MKRVLYPIPSVSKGWLGGANYLRNIITALANPKDSAIVPVILCNKGEQGNVRDFIGCDVAIIESNICKAKSLLWFARYFFKKILNRDILLEMFCRLKSIDMVSHGDPLGKDSPLPNAFWIPDFQHVYLPQFFSQKEINQRNRRWRYAASHSSVIVVSSADALSHLRQFSPDHYLKGRVLRFVPNIDLDKIPRPSELINAYKLPSKFIYLPNQVWQHKNHLIVCQSLLELRDTVPNIRIICSGLTKDYRCADVFREILQYIAEHDLGNNVTFIGVVPYDHVLGLMVYSHAVINPSLFEGWSTSVEEAKLLRKRIVLSDIPIHREQCPDAIFFSPTDSHGCAQAIESCWSMDPVPIDLAEISIHAQNEFAKFGVFYRQQLLMTINDHDKR